MILIKHPNIKESQLSNSNLSIDSLKLIVGGSIDLVNLWSYDRSNPVLKDIVIIIRDDGAIIPNPQPNIRIGNTILFGIIAIAAYDKQGNIRGLQPNEITAMDKYLVQHSMNFIDKPSIPNLLGEVYNA